MEVTRERCGAEIQGDPDTYIPASASGAASTIRMCKGGCRPSPHQSTQERPVVLAPVSDPRSRQRRRPRRSRET
ncbi:hypothetical protein GCM10027072_28370 [Streptomyces bullii]